MVNQTVLWDHATNQKLISTTTKHKTTKLDAVMISSEELLPIKASGPWASGHLRSCSLEITWGHLLSGSLNLWHPYKRISIIDSSFKFCDEKYLSETLLRRFCLSVTKKRATYEKAFCCFRFCSTVTHSDYSILEIMAEFVFF